MNSLLFLKRFSKLGSISRTITKFSNVRHTRWMSHSVPGLFLRAEKAGNKVAIVDDESHAFTYRQLLNDASNLSTSINSHMRKPQKDISAKIVFLFPGDYSYVVSMVATWHRGAVAVPLSTHQTEREIEYVVQDCEASLIMYHPMFETKIENVASKLNIPSLKVSSAFYGSNNKFTIESVQPSEDALIIYTSGTTGQPKGVVSTHFILESQITSLLEAWKWTSKDCILNILPLHHVHGIVNVLNCSLWSGATCVMHKKFHAETVWNKLLDKETFPSENKLEKKEIPDKYPISVFMAVPTVYNKLITCYEKNLVDPETKCEIKEYLKTNIRLFVSGSAALPVPVLEKWKSISGHTLLERYGMTEIGMGLSNSYEGERFPGKVGLPLPKVQAQLVDIDAIELKHGNISASNYLAHVVEGDGVGELWIKAPTVFDRYLNKPEATTKAFVDGWFRTGDSAERKNSIYQILGRLSADILKSGGYKIGALEIEGIILEHEEINECTVFGIDDKDWGQIIATLIVKKDNKSPLNEEDLTAWAKTRMSHYKVPSVIHFVDEIPKNAMGKVSKKQLAQIYQKKTIM